MNKIIYFHGYGSSSNSSTIRTLRKIMPECQVVAPDIPVDPAEALPFLRGLCQTEQPDIVIGTSMGGMYALQMNGFRRICVNPALNMSQLSEVLKVGTWDYFQPTQDGRKRFSITPEIIANFRNMEAHLYDNLTPQDAAQCYGFFADADELVHSRPDFAEHIPLDNIFDFHGGHRISPDVLRDVLVPFIRESLGLAPES